MWKSKKPATLGLLLGAAATVAAVAASEAVPPQAGRSGATVSYRVRMTW
ncbi:MAG: hypothetical protein HYY12_04715 [Candidatus Methylomirabilis oxyfera]|nr:hypothetical protein [Candidatus Methylomirabilis oxyfera]